MTTILVVVIAVVCLLAGVGIAYFVFKQGLKNKVATIIREAEIEAEVIKKNKMLEVKEKFLNKKSELEKEVQQRNQKIQQAENRLKQRELSLNQRQDELQRRKSEAEAAK